MREIVQIQVGGFGNNVSLAFWEQISKEHNLDLSGKITSTSKTNENMHTNVLFNNIMKTDKFVPRAVFLDLEPSCIENIQSGECGKLFDVSNFCYAKEGAGGNWQKARNGIGAEIQDKAMDIIRKQIELCDSVEAIQYCFSMIGSAGSGFGTLILNQVRDEYPALIHTNFCQFIPPETSDNVLAYYNLLLGISTLQQDSDLTFLFDNKAAFNFSANNSDFCLPDDYKTLNKIFANSMCTLSASARFGGLSSGSQRKIAVNMVPSPRMHFLTMSQISIGKPSKSEIFANKMVENVLFNEKYFLNTFSPFGGCYFTSTLLSQGNIATSNIYEQITNTRQKFPQYIKNTLYNPIGLTNCRKNPLGKFAQITALGNSTYFCEIGRMWDENIRKAYKRNAFLHHYTEAGMDLLEFQEALTNFNDLYSEYDTFDCNLLGAETNENIEESDEIEN